jgi:hypothetical protein
VKGEVEGMEMGMGTGMGTGMGLGTGLRMGKGKRNRDGNEVLIIFNTVCSRGQSRMICIP